MNCFLVVNFYICILVLSYLQRISKADNELLNNLKTENGNISILYRKFQDVLRKVPYQLRGIINEKCEEHLQLFKVDLQNMKPWALQMLDSSTKIPDGILNGNMFYMGDFDECVNVNIPDGLFSGQYCLVMISKHSNSTHISKQESSLRMYWSTCIPSSCSPEDLHTLIQGVFVMYNNSLKIEVGKYNCQTKDSNSQLYTGDWIFIVVLILLSVLVILSTGYDVLHRDPGSRKTLYLSFSLYTNGKKLFATSSSEESLHCLHGIRFLTMAWIVLDHQYMLYYMYSPLVNLADVADVFTKWYRMYLLNGTLSVDTFFLMSGLLISYIFFTRMKDKSLSSFNVPHFYLHRYIRLTPLLAILLFLQVTLLRVFGSGPLWDTGYESITEPCHKYWWSTLLYVQNYVNPSDMCLGHTWYLSVDMQLYLLSPLVLVLLWKKPKTGIIILSGTIAGGIIINFILAYMYEFCPKPINTGTFNYQQEEFYYPTHTRFPSWITGIILGYFIFKINGKTKRLQKIKIMCGWLVSSILTLGSLYVAYPMMQRQYLYNPWECSIYMSVFRTAWSLGISWIIYACFAGYGGAVNTLLSWYAWQPLSRLTYGIYLIHVFVMTYESFTSKVPIYFSDTNIVIYFLGNLCISTFLAAILSLVLEYPVVSVEKYLLEKCSIVIYFEFNNDSARRLQSST